MYKLNGCVYTQFVNIILKLNKLLRNILYFGFAPKPNIGRGPIKGTNRVAAGDPTKGVRILKSIGNLPEKLKYDDEIIDVMSYTAFDVVGSSMSPEGISDGDRLLCEPIKENSEIAPSTFIIIKTDEDYYRWKNRELKFEYKLRCSLTGLPISQTIDELIEDLENKTNSILLPENQKILRAKFKDAHEFYDNEKGTRSLMLSITYREGALRYSFHPTSLVKYKAVYVLKNNNGEWTIKKL